jgi:hypothetical protein
MPTKTKEIEQDAVADTGMAQWLRRPEDGTPPAIARW